MTLRAAAAPQAEAPALRRWAAPAVLAGLAAGASIPVVLGLAVALGRNIPSANLATDYEKGVLWALVLGASIVIWPVPRLERVALVGIWVIKCVVALGFMLLYEWSYPLDAYEYFAASQELHRPTDVVGSGTGSMEAITWWHAHYLVSSYHAMKVSFAFLGLIAVFLLYRAACRAIGIRSHLRLLVGLACFPSVLFWSSILGKDPITLFGIAIYAYGMVRWLRGGDARDLLGASVGVAIAASIRIWLAPILVTPAFIASLMRVRTPGRRVLILVLGMVGLGLALVEFRSVMALGALSDILEYVGSSSQAWAEGGSGQQVAADLSSPGTLLLFLPRGMFAALFRPLPGEVMNAFGLLSGLENLGLLSLLALAIRRTRWKDFRDPIVLWATLLVLVWAAIYSPISFQNLGTAVRFRLQVLPVLLLLLLHLARRRTAARAATIPRVPKASS